MDRSMAILSLVAVACCMLSCETDAHLISLGHCKNVTAFQNFDAKRIVGAWYEVSRSLAIDELWGTCPKVFYQVEETTGDIVAVYTILMHGKEIRMSTRVTPVDLSKKEGRFVGHVDVATLYFLGQLTVSAPFMILDTDYEHYAMVYSCIDLGVINAGVAVVVSRTPVLDQVYKDRVEAVLREKGLGDKKLKDAVQNCGARY